MTRVANLPRRRRPTSLALRASRNALGVGGALGFATELFQENAIFFLEVFDDSLLVSAHPAGDSDQEELELSRHRERESLKSFFGSILNVISAEFFGSTGNARPAPARPGLCRSGPQTCCLIAAQSLGQPKRGLRFLKFHDGADQFG